MLPLPPKLDGGYVFTRVCLFVSERDISKGCGWIWMKFGGEVGCVTMTKLLDFGEVLDLDIRIFKVIIHY